MKPIILASTRINSCGSFIRTFRAHAADDMLLAATTLGRYAGTRNHTAYSYHSNTPSLITSSNVGREVFNQPITRRLFSSAIKISGLTDEPGKRGRKVWKAQQEKMGDGDGRDANDGGGATGESRVNNYFWGTAVDDAHDFRESLSGICEQVCESFCLVFFLGAHCC